MAGKEPAPDCDRGQPGRKRDAQTARRTRRTGTPDCACRYLQAMLDLFVANVPEAGNPA
jgi:hypothetical protein